MKKLLIVLIALNSFGCMTAFERRKDSGVHPMEEFRQMALDMEKKARESDPEFWKEMDKAVSDDVLIIEQKNGVYFAR